MSATQQATQAQEPGTALELLRPEQRALMQPALDIGVLVNQGGMAVIDLSSPEILANYNVLAPARIMVQANPNWTPSISVLSFDRTRGSLYSVDKKWNPRTKQEDWRAFSFGKLELLQIAKAMGLRVLAPEIKIGQGEMHRDILITSFVAERDIDGTWRIVPGSQMWLYDDEHERTVADCPDTKYQGSGDDRHQVNMSQQEKDTWIKKNFMQRKEFALRMTETKSLEAAIRAIGSIPASMPIADLARPFIFLRTTLTPDPSNTAVLLSQIDAGEAAMKGLYGPSASTPELEEVRRILGGPAESAPITDPQTGLVVDPVTGVIEGTCTEETDEGAAQTAAAEPEGETHGQRPTDDRTIPRGKYGTRLLSEICKEDPAYAREHFLDASPPLGPTTAEWLVFWHGAERDDFSDCTF